MFKVIADGAVIPVARIEDAARQCAEAYAKGCETLDVRVAPMAPALQQERPLSTTEHARLVALTRDHLLLATPTED
jgi:hypothetical protein